MSYPVVRLRDISSQPRLMAHWEKFKHVKIHLLTEMIAEMIGVFIYVYAGTGATVAFTVGNLASQPIGSLFTIGFGYAIGIVLAITICGATSACHFSPSVTISFVVLRGFPIRKAIMYILAQILGAYLACLLIYVQWKDMIMVAEEVLLKKGLYDTLMFTPSGPAGVFAFYVMPRTNLNRVLLNEFMTDLVLGLAISASIDPTNQFVPPAATPWIIGFTYGMAVWGYAPTSIAANTARDVGGRLMALTIWGTRAAGGTYSALAALTNIPAMVIAFFLYDTFLGSSARTLTSSHIAYFRATKMYQEEYGLVPPGFLSALEPRRDATSSGSFDERHMKSADSMNV